MKGRLIANFSFLVLCIIQLNAQVSPGGVSTDLNYWLKADAGVTTFDATISGVPVKRVSQWDNQTNGSTNNIGGIEDFTRPVFIENGLNFNPAINFDGTNDFLRTDNGWDSHSVIIVFNPTTTLDTNTGVQLILVYDVPNNTVVDSGIGIGDLGAVSSMYAACSDNYFFNSGDRNIPGAGNAPEFIGCSGDATTTSTDDAVLAVVRPNISETSPEHKLFGENQITNIVNPDEYGVHSDRPFTIGQRHGGGFFYGGDVLEAISYSSRVSDADIVKIESYLALKYGLTLSQTTPQDYINSNGISIYDSDNTLDDFDFNIAGIGRDDASGLNQKQSISTTTNSVQTNTPGIITIGLGSIANTNLENTNNFDSNQSFMLWGNNAGALTINTNVPTNCGSLNRMERIWAIQETGLVGNVSIRIPQSFFNQNSPTLLISNDTTFDNNDSLIALSDDSNGNYIATVDFSTGDYFTFGQLDHHITEFAGISVPGWTNGIPSINSTAIISIDYDTGVQGLNIDACEIIIKDIATVTIRDGDFLNTVNNITVNGTLVIENQGSLVQSNAAATVIKGPSGIIEVQKTTPSVEARNFIVMSSPMNGETRDGVYQNARAVFSVIPSNFAPFDIDFGVFPEFEFSENFLDDNLDYLQPITGNTALPNAGIGQFIFPSATIDDPVQSYNLSYTGGTLNSGTITIPINYNGPATTNNYNLLGNPYPSAIDVTALINTNDAINEVYYWDHITTPSSDLPGFGSSNFSMNDISMRNAMMGIAAINGGTPPGQFMASGQGFGIKADQSQMISNSPVVFTNDIRVTGNNSDFRSNEVSDINKLWIRLTTSAYEEAIAQTAIGFTNFASQTFDKGYDSPRLGTFLSLFSVLETGEHLAIQGREAFDPNIELTLGFSTSIDTEETYTIGIDHLEGISIENTPIYLIDHFVNTIINLKEEDYSFVSNKGIQSHRFTILFKERQTLDIEEQENGFEESITLYPNPTNENITLSYTGENNLTQLRILDIAGRLVEQINLSSFNRSLQIDLSNYTIGLYFIEIQSNTRNITKKIIIK